MIQFMSRWSKKKIEYLLLKLSKADIIKLSQKEMKHRITMKVKEHKPTV